MKRILLVVLIALFGMVSNVQAQIKWMSMSEALSAQKKNKKPIFLDAYTVWCGPCKMLDKQTFSDEAFAKFINDNYNPVKFNAEGNEEFSFQGKAYKNPGYQEARKNSRNSVHEFTLAIGVRAYPTMMVIDQNGKVIKNIMGVRPADELMKELK
ncbi:thioredoxin family protein [Capnocytophaga sp. ARDL2]|uniref:thioredoxin family protein n=1 Tax=Capnocytophaga sp. ARDL2 TaxID=3238809 RepID=UPI0035567CD4